MSAESMSPLSSCTCIKVNLDKVNIIQPPKLSNMQTTADWGFLALLILVRVNYTESHASQLNNHRIKENVKWFMNGMQ